MKKFLLIFAFLISFKQVNSATLVFNQILTFSGITTNTQQYNTICVVPLGKTWKVESFTLYGGTSFTLFNGLRTNAFSTTFNSYSFWMKAGDSLGVEQFYNTSNYTISIIEYNIVP